MSFFYFVINTIILVEIAIAGNVVQSQFKQARALSSLITSALDQSKERFHKIERDLFSQPFVASYRQLSSSSNSEVSDGGVGGPDIVAYLVSSQKEPILRTGPEAGEENATDITVVNTSRIISTTSSVSTYPSSSATPSSLNSTGPFLTLDVPTNSTLRKKDRKKKKKKKDKKIKKNKKEEKKKTAGENTEEIKESLRSCTSKSIKSCRSACKDALKDACETYTCKGKFKGTFKKESKKMCKQMFNEPRRPKERYNSEEDW